MRRLVTLSLLLSLMLSSLGANYRFEHITSHEGLPHQQITSLACDQQGYLWIGTRNGLARYDGNTMRTYYNEPSDSLSINHNFINQIYVDRANDLWVTAQDCISRYDRATGTFHRYLLGGLYTNSIAESPNGKLFCAGEQLFYYDREADAFVKVATPMPDYILSIAFDPLGRLFVATNNCIYYYDEKLTTTTQLPAEVYSSFLRGGDGIVPMTFDARGRLWVGRNGDGAMWIDLFKDKQQVIPGSRLTEGTVRAILQHPDGSIWLGTEKGISIINPDGSVEMARSNFSDPYSLNDGSIYALVCDKNRNVWIGTYFGGVNLCRPVNQGFEVFRPRESGPGLRGKVIRQIRPAADNHLWIASEDAGLHYMDLKTDEIIQAPDAPTFGYNVHSLCYDATGRYLWIGTFRNGLFCYDTLTGSKRHYMPDDGSGLGSDAIFDLALQDEHRLWIATTRGLYWVDPTNPGQIQRVNWAVLDYTFSYALLLDSDHNLWVGTVQDGLFRINADNSQLMSWHTSLADCELTDNYVTALYQDRKGTVWIGTSNGGLHRTISNGKVRIEHIDDPRLPKPLGICAIMQDADANLWITTSNGLYKCSETLDVIERFSTETGLPSNQFNYSSALLAPNGKIYMGTVNGLVTFNPQTLAFPRTNLQVHLDHLIINNQEMSANDPHSPIHAELDCVDKIVLDYDQGRSFCITYGIVAPGYIANIDYQVKLENADSKWRSMGHGTRFTAVDLPPGNYKLKIRASVGQPNWDNSPVKELDIVIKPPFYLSSWAMLIYGILICIVVILVYKFFAMCIRGRNAVLAANMERDKIKEVNEAKMDFFSAVSHELKTPLSLIIAPLRQLSNNEMDPESSKLLGIAVKNTDRMVAIINELLTFNKMESGNFQFMLEYGNPVRYVETLAVQFQQRAQEQSLTYYINCEDNEEEVWFSTLYVERIVDNLLSNAMKFTLPGGTVSLRAGIATREGDPYKWLRIQVSDTGIGIVKEEQENIFSRYYQTKRGVNTNHRGWGLGLFLVKRLCELHKGWVKVDSEVGVGSTFTVYLCVSAEAYDPSVILGQEGQVISPSEYKFDIPISKPVALTPVGLNTDKKLEQKTPILIVEDDAELLDFLTHMFSSAYEVHTATNGADALKRATEYPFALVISDVMMPEMDGYELCRELKSDIKTSHIPVILLTAKGGTDDIVRGYESGAEAYVPKPFDPQILDLQVKNIIKARRSQQQTIANAPSQQEIEDLELTPLDKDFINKINQLIDENIENSEFSVADITSAMGISRSLLYTKMRSLLNVSIGDLIRKKRLNKARELMVQGYNISESAYQSGFSNPNYLSKAFRKEYGCSPSEYINEIKSKKMNKPKDQ